jgi:hypothetical protein
MREAAATALDTVSGHGRVDLSTNAMLAVALTRCFKLHLDHVIVLDESHPWRLAQEYLRYYHQDRTHDALNKDTPAQRPALHRNAGERLQSMPRLGGLHHRYFGARAA